MKLDDLTFEVAALIGTVDFPLEIYHDLRVGDILLLDQKVDALLTIKVGEDSCFKGRPGLSETRKAVRIDERIHSR